MLHDMRMFLRFISISIIDSGLLFLQEESTLVPQFHRNQKGRVCGEKILTIPSLISYDLLFFHIMLRIHAANNSY